MLNTSPKWPEVVADKKEERGHWHLGRTVEMYPGKDRRTRLAKVQCRTRTVVRPVHQLVLLQVKKV